MKENLIKIITDEDFHENSIELSNPRLRYGSRGIVVNKDGKIAVFHKKNKNEYKLPGGGFEINENPESAFIRETLEETGCEVEIIKQLGITEEYKSLDNFKQKSYVFVAQVVKDYKKLNLTEEEKLSGGELVWLDLKEAYTKISESINYLKCSKEIDLYHSKFIVYRDSEILKYYMEK